jgi:integrase-like protein
MEQMARNVTMEGTGFLANCRYLLHDRDSKYCPSFRHLIAAGKVKCPALPPKSPNLNAFAERWVRSVKEECLSKLILFGERSLKRALHHYEIHYHQERNHQGKDKLAALSFVGPIAALETPKTSMPATVGWPAEVL